MKKLIILFLILISTSAYSFELSNAGLALMMDAMNAPAASSTLGNGLIAHYKMNDTNNINLTDSKSGYTGTGTYTSVTGLINRATSWNNDFVKSVVPVPTNTYSMCFWAKCNPPAHILYTAISKDIIADRSFGVYFNGDYDRIQWWQYNNVGTLYLLEGPNMVLGEWLHVVGMWNSGNTNLTLYTNGAWAASMVVSGAAHDSVTQFAIGYEGLSDSGEHRHYYGELDDLRIYDRILTQSEISQLYNSGSGTEDE